MNLKIKSMGYTKDNGDFSRRRVIVVSEPKENYLMYDVSKLTDSELEYLTEALTEIEQTRTDCLQEFEDVTKIKLNRLWRSFKPGGINWEE